MRLLLFICSLFIFGSLTGCCFGIKCEPCEVASGIWASIDTSTANGFDKDLIDTVFVIKNHSHTPVDTIVYTKEKLISNSHGIYWDVDIPHHNASDYSYTILEKDSLFVKQLNDFNFIYIKSDGGCCDCGDYYHLNSFEVDGKTITDGAFMISK